MDRTQVLAQVNTLLLELDGRRPDVQMLNNYYRGKHHLRFMSENWKRHHQDRYSGFSDNWCAPVADAPSERQRLIGIRLSDDATGQSSEEKTLWDDWVRNEGDLQSSQGFLQSIISSRSFVLVNPDDDGTPELSWLTPGQAIVSYDPMRPSKRRAGLRSWIDENVEHAVLYMPDRIYHLKRRAARESSGLILSGAASTAGDWEITGDYPNQLQLVPLVEVPNRPMLDGTPMSDIRGTKSMQDAINLLWAYLFSAADHASLPARVITGQEPPKIPIMGANGEKIGEKPIDLEQLERGRMLWLTGQNAKIDQWDPATLSVFTEVTETAISHIAAQTRTPPHYLVANKGMSNLSGDALVAAETGLVKKVEEQQLYFSAAMREVFRLMALIRKMGTVADSIKTAEVQWADAAMRSDAQRADALIKKKQVGYPLRYLLESDGHGPVEVERILKMRREELAEDPLSAATQQIRQGVPNESAVSS